MPLIDQTKIELHNAHEAGRQAAEAMAGRDDADLRAMIEYGLGFVERLRELQRVTDEVTKCVIPAETC